MFHLNGTVIAY